jgi:hypothetical protein
MGCEDNSSEPTNLPEIWPSMVEIKDVQPSPAGNYNFGWVYKMASMRFEGASETIESITNQRAVTKSTKGIASTFVWMYESEDVGTKLTLEVEYVVPIPLLHNTYLPPTRDLFPKHVSTLNNQAFSIHHIASEMNNLYNVFTGRHTHCC